MSIRKLYNVEAANLARQNGCSPFFWPPYRAYCCGCEDLLHASDQQCSIISAESAAKVRAASKGKDGQ